MHTEVEFTQNLARKGTPNLYVAARFLEPEQKFRAFLVTYAAMRLVDDVVDDYRASGGRKDSMTVEIIDRLDNFADMISNQKIDNSLPYAQELKLAINRFRIPSWPFTLLVDAMKFDLHHDRFDTMDEFLQYSEGAAVAPGSIFMHLAGCSCDNQGLLFPPRFNIRNASRPLSIFSYLVHIIRDFKKDYLAGPRPLVYLNVETMDMFCLGEQDLALAVQTGQQSLKFTKMVKWYYHKIIDYQQRAAQMLNDLEPLLPKDGFFALNLIYELYSLSAAKISQNGYIIARGGLNVSYSEIEQALRGAAVRSQMEPTPALERLANVLHAPSA